MALGYCLVRSAALHSLFITPGNAGCNRGALKIGWPVMAVKNMPPLCSATAQNYITTIKAQTDVKGSLCRGKVHHEAGTQPTALCQVPGHNLGISMFHTFKHGISGLALTLTFIF